MKKLLLFQLILLPLLVNAQPKDNEISISAVMFYDWGYLQPPETGWSDDPDVTYVTTKRGGPFEHLWVFSGPITKIPADAFKGSPQSGTMILPNSIKEVGSKAFYGTKCCTIPDSIEKIGAQAYCSSSIYSVNLSNNLKSIDDGAFMGCKSLALVHINHESTIEIIPNLCFYECEKLKDISIPDNIKTICNQAFSGCTQLNKIILPENINCIKKDAFFGCSQLDTIVCNSETPPLLEENNFTNAKQNGTLCVPKGCVDIYRETEGWKDFFNIIDNSGYYKLIYYIDGKEYKAIDIKYGSQIIPDIPPVKEGYSFSGWKDLPDNMPSRTVRVYGSYIINNYKLSYFVDGDEYKSYDIEYGTKITPETEPIKEGYIFSGWSEIPETMPAHDVTVTGTFTIKKYKLTYMVDGEEYKTYDIEYGSTINPEATPTKEGYTFSGWSEIPETMPANDVTVTGAFTINNYKLTYMVDGAEYKSYDIEYGATITPEAAPTKEGYTFSGWSEIPQTMPAKDVTVTGTFTVNKYKLTYMVDGAEYKSYEIEYGAKITPETEPIKEGYSFSGWSSIPETMPAKDVVVTGTFSKGSYKLTYMVDGAVYKTVSYDYGDRITPEAAPTKEGYTFSGWSNIPATMPAKDVTVTGTFTINKYKLTYKVDGEIYKTYEIEYGKAITPEAEPTKEGYTFSGWNEIPSTMPAHDVEVMGTFIQVEFVIDDVTYEISGEGTVTIKGSDQKGEVTIDATVVINGQTYRVTAIADNAFKENQSITSVTIPEGITTIGDNAFNGCINLIVINIGKDVQSIGNKAFANVGTASAARTRSEESMLIVNCYAESVPQTASDAFENTPIENGTLMVEDNSVNAYKATSPWSRFGRILGFDEAAGINTISIDSVNAHIYDMQGNRLDNPQKGVNIIRMKDGKTKKMMVK